MNTNTLLPDTTPMSWDFTYEGPVTKEDNRTCHMCTAVSMGKCQRDAVAHGSNSSGCSSCFAARVGHCHNHCGLQEALEQHTAQHDIHEGHSETFTHAMDAVLTYVSSLPTADVKRVYVKAFSHQDMPDASFAKFSIEVVAFK